LKLLAQAEDEHDERGDEERSPLHARDRKSRRTAEQIRRAAEVTTWLVARLLAHQRAHRVCPVDTAADSASHGREWPGDDERKSVSGPP